VVEVLADLGYMHEVLQIKESEDMEQDVMRKLIQLRHDEE
jgi:hypothetical protein